MNTRLVLPLLVISLTACSSSEKSTPSESTTGHSPSATADHEHADLPKRVKLTEEVITAAKITTAPVRREKLAKVLNLPGEVTADPDRVAHVAPPVEGRIERVAFKEGSLVEKGDLLAVIRVPELSKVRGALASTKAQAKAARSNADRLKHLVERNLAAAQEYENADAAASALEAESQSLAAELSSLGASATGGASLSLRTPLRGVVVGRDAVVGQPVARTTVIATVADLSQVWFLGRVFEKDLGQLREGTSADVELNAFPTQHFPGKLEFLGKQVDPVARTITARILLSNPDNQLRLGLFGVARVSTGEESSKPLSLVIARGAVTEIGNKPVVFVQLPGGEFELHEVILGASALGKVEVLSGLDENESVVVEGVFTLKSAVLKSAFAEEE
ncbi:MAG: efflux RND transporter periplasmic adaptor subunit [Polyangiaceae bacterium]|nr:efflux RND transporter periplasmic adaptor subunit [Polyangiaceae bacterium]